MYQQHAFTPELRHALRQAEEVWDNAATRAAIAAQPDIQVHDEICFTGPDAAARAALYARTLHLELDICRFEQWQRERRTYNRMMASALRARIAQ